MSDVYQGSVYNKPFPDSVISKDIQSSDTEIRQQACWKLASLYFDPLVSYLLQSRKFSLNREEAKDLVNEFIFKRIVEGRIVEGFDPFYGGQKRKFRHYLCRNLGWLVSDEKRKKAAGPIGDYDPISPESDPPGFDDDIYEYVVAANLLIQSFLAVKADCRKKKQTAMWEVFVSRVIKQAITGQKENHADIAKRLGLESPRRSRYLLEAGLQKFKSFANRIIQEAEPGIDRRTPEELFKILARPPIANFDLRQHLESLAELSAEGNEAIPIKTGEDLKSAAKSWLNDREVASHNDEERRWRQILYQTVSQYQNGEQTSGELPLSFSELMSGSDETLWDILFHSIKAEKQRTDILRRSKQYLQKVECRVDIAMHRTVYALVHACDIVNHQACNSRSEPEVLLSVFKYSLSKPWLDEQSRWQLNTAANFLRAKTALRGA
ncbi:hypothetical protein N9Y42_03065 [Mariniblastus sp.]|nr:hypothetical protein [Mariniblastus sp.]